MYLNQVSSQFRLPGGRQGDARLHRDFSVLGHDGLGSELAGRGGSLTMVRTEETPTAHGALQGGEAPSHVDGGEGGGDGEYDMGLDEFLEVLKEELPIVQKQDNSVGSPYKVAEQEMAPNTPVVFEAAEEHMLFPTHVQQEQEIAPHTPAVPEAYHHGMAVPSTNKMTHNFTWLQDLNEDGEGFEDNLTNIQIFNPTDMIPTGSPHQLPLMEFLRPEIPVDLDHDRPQQNDGSVLASNWTPTERFSPDPSRQSNSNSSSPVAMFDQSLRNEFTFSPSVGQNNISQYQRPFNISLAPSVVDLTSDSSDGSEEESELRELSGGSQGKRKLPGWAETEQKKPRPSGIWPPRQPNGHSYANYPSSAYLKKAPEMHTIPGRSQSWNPSMSKFSLQVGRMESSATTATSMMRVVPTGQALSNMAAYRDAHSSSIVNIAHRSSSGEVSTSYDRHRPRVLPGTLAGPITSISNGVQHAAAAVDPALALKRSEELAYQAVLQAFSLADEKEEATPEEGLLAMSLLKHQKMALAWMVKRESGRQEPCGGILADDQGLGKTISTIALILKNRAPIQKPGSKGVEPPQVEGSTVDLDDEDDDPSYGNGQRRFDMSNWPTSLPSISGSPQLPEELKTSQASSKGRPAAGTLVVCPTSVLRQWAQEIRDKVTAEAKVSVLVYHGSGRTRDPQELAKYDVVLSTYSIVSMEVPKQPLPEEKDEDKRNPNEYGFVPFSKPKKEKPEKVKKAKGKGRGVGVDGDTSIAVDSGPLARVAWFRVVLDEAQSIKNYRTQVARAAWGLRAKRRWCLSGTPIQNSVDDLFSYFRFLRYFPWDTYKKFQYDIKDPVSRNPSEGYRKLQAILKPIVLRRTKTCLIDGKPIVNLPPRIVKLQQAEFSLDERTFYTNLEAESRAQFQEYAAAGTVQSNYVNILWMLLRLRQACDHPMLVKKCSKAAAGQKTSVESARKLPPPQRLELIQCLEGSRTLCNICQDAPEDPVVSICSHVFCRQCISEQMANGDDTTCRYPKCKRALNSTLLYSLAALKDLGLGNGCSTTDTDPSVAVAAKGEEITWRTSSKIDAVINTLQALPPTSYLVEDGKLVKGPKAEKFLEAESMRFELTKIEQIKYEQTEFEQKKLETKFEQTKIEQTAFEQKKLETKFEQTKIEQTGAECTALMVTAEPAGSLIEKVESTEKAIVFSQWTSMLDLLETPLKNAGFCYRRLDGTMSVLARDKAVSDFNTRPEVTVMIMSLKAASLGLNMVAACHVLLLDVWWNPTTEDQAIDRAHRIGQTRTVNVSRFTVKNTIEDRILELQERKRQIVASAFGENEGGEQKTRLTVEDLRYLFRV